MAQERIAAELIAEWLEQTYDLTNLRFAYVSGSLYEGLGDRFSDLDVYVVRDRTAVEQQTNADEPNEFFFRKFGRDVEVTDLSFDEVKSLIELMDGKIGRADQLPPYRLRLAHRILTAEPLIGHEEFIRVRDAISPANLCHAQAENCLRIGYSNFLDTLGGLELDPCCAYRASIALVESCTDMLTALYGMTGSISRWRFHRLRELALRGENWASNLSDDLLPAISIGDEARIAAYIDRAFGLFQVVCDAWLRWNLGDDPARTLISAQLKALYAPEWSELRRNNRCQLISWGGRTDMALYLDGRETFAINKKVAHIWLTLGMNGRKANIVDALEELGIPAEGALSLIEKWIARGLVHQATSVVS